MSEFIHREKWDEWEKVRMRVLAGLAATGKNIPIVLDEESAQHEKCHGRGKSECVSVL